MSADIFDSFILSACCWRTFCSGSCMKVNCPNFKCPSLQAASPITGSIVSNGSFYRKSDSRRIQRYFCKSCSKHFSKASAHPCFLQKKRRINPVLKKLLCSGVSQRRAAQILMVNPKTVIRRFRFLASQARIEHENWLKRYIENPVYNIQFDDLETSEHTKCKPLSVAIAIDTKNRKIMGFQVAAMPAKGHLAKTAIRKYGYRKDQRGVAWDQMMKQLKPFVSKNAVFTSDENPHYPKYLFNHHPDAIHIQMKGGRGAITGQGELKKLKYDPLFLLNHTCAMLRANLNRLFRKTWCTTKNQQGLKDHLDLFVSYFNKVLTDQSAAKGGS